MRFGEKMGYSIHMRYSAMSTLSSDPLILHLQLVISDSTADVMWWWSGLLTATDIVDYTVSKRESHLMFDNKFGKSGPIFKILSPIDLWESSLCIHHKDFHLTCNMLLHLPCETRKSKNVTEFSRWMWQLICLTKICCDILCNLPQKYCTNDFT